MLPIDVAPEAGESLVGVIARSARHMGLSTSELVEFLGLQTERTRPHNLTLPVDPALRSRLMAVLEIDDATLNRMAVSGLPAFRRIPSATPHNGAALTLQRGYWWMFDIDRFCPACLQADCRWLVTWQHPWSFACVDHAILLAQACTGCGSPSRLTGRSDWATDVHCSCGTPWSSISQVPVDEQACAVQVRLNATVASARSRLWGSMTTSLNVLGAWRAGATLLAGRDEVPRWAPRPWMTPPDPSTTGIVMVKAAPVLTARTAESAAAALRRQFNGEDDTVTNLIRDRLPSMSPLTPVLDAWQRTRHRVATRIDRVHQQQAFDLIGLGARPLPTVAPLDVLPDDWLTPAAPHVLLRRCAISLAAARLIGAATWEEAGARVGVSARYAPRVVRYVMSRAGADAPARLSDAAGVLARLARTRDFSRGVAAPAIDSFVALKSFAATVEVRVDR